MHVQDRDAAQSFEKRLIRGLARKGTRLARP
jgi:hypothetical protein